MDDTPLKLPKKRAAVNADEDGFDASKAVTKKPKASRPGKGSQKKSDFFLDRLFTFPGTGTPSEWVCGFPGRLHALMYHRPLLLDSVEGRASLLEWFDGVSTSRAMPWRKAWIDPSLVPDPTELRLQLEKRAYQVWISEIMLQQVRPPDFRANHKWTCLTRKIHKQTRVAVVIGYWNKWMTKWPTIHDLAAASADDVLAAWRGLGYYSRATRIHEAAKLICADKDMRGLLPNAADELEAKIPGVGRYTAGAISAICFGRAAPMVDGNVLRVLCRQLGVFGNVKTDKMVIDMLWAAADALVKAVAQDTPNGDRDTTKTEASDRPGRWGQALMELGSTTCTPKPNCASCPITSTCRAYEEGLRLTNHRGAPQTLRGSVTVDSDIEDLCDVCSPFEETIAEVEGDGHGSGTTSSLKRQSQPRKQTSLQSSFMAAKTSSPTVPNTADLEVVTNHARRFPVKGVKKAVREQQTLVCAIRRRDSGHYLIHKRPQKGLLAGLWEFPSQILQDGHQGTPKARKQEARLHASSVLGLSPQGNGLEHVGELGSVPWQFSHLKLTMHVHLFNLDGAAVPDEAMLGDAKTPKRWSGTVEDESMGTGMRKCWELVRDAIE